MKKLTDNEFADFYYTKIYPFIKSFNKKRDNMLINLFLKIIMLLIVSIAFFYYSISNIEQIGYPIFGICLLMLIATGSCIIGNHIKSYQKNLKETFYSQIFAQLDLIYSNFEKDVIIAQNIMDNICEKSHILKRHDKINIDDTWQGTYNNLPLKIYDAEIIYSQGKTTATLFKGIFIASKINKNFQYDTLIKDELACGDFIKLNNIKLEDIKFEEEFKVYGEDQIESRYLLTPSFMNRLLEYKNKKGYSIEIVLSNNMNMEENVFLFINNYKDNFELPIFKKIDKDGFYNVIKEIYDALEIIDALKLEQNIGM